MELEDRKLKKRKHKLLRICFEGAEIPSKSKIHIYLDCGINEKREMILTTNLPEGVYIKDFVAYVLAKLRQLLLVSWISQDVKFHVEEGGYWYLLNY